MSSQPSGGLSLFPSPNTSRPPPLPRMQPRRSESRERRAPTPQEWRASPSPGPSQPSSPPRNGRQTPQNRARTPVDFSPSSPERGSQSPLQRVQEGFVQPPRPVADVPGRSGSALAEAPMVVRKDSVRSRSSIAKLPFNDGPESPSQPIRSIFPTYNPEVPLGQQQYGPTQMSPTHIPRAVISRQEYHGDAQSPIRSPVRSPLSAEPAPNTWPRRAAHEPPVIPQTCTTDHLKGLWKVTNGWKASSSEGRVYCMRMSQQKDAPIYTLSSSTQPFYNVRIDPTSASAYVTVTRLDPSKPYKGPKPDSSSTSSSVRSGIAGISIGGGSGGGSGSGSKSSDSKHWHEALTTTMEEESRKHPPNDGLVALLMPTAATKMALEKQDDPTAVMLAERECARLVWDEDSANHFLVHPALATPFCVTIERSPAWSRVEYTLEHHESPHHLAKLTRDSTGGGWLELDTGLASKIEAFFITDVAVTALLLVAAADEKNMPATVEAFDPPPPTFPAPDAIEGGDGRRLSNMLGRRDDKKQQKKRKMEEFEIDVESQDSSLGKASKAKDGEDKLPFLIRVVVKLAKGLFKFFLFLLTVGVKCFGGLFKCVYKCVGSKY
ncbi:hypothetical protein HJFPF1_00320 [Paramyrothecium foliicola]|nr:hypothetical protein HJFPF1_00320 [Paramyrothecium foliicola]